MSGGDERDLRGGSFGGKEGSGGGGEKVIFPFEF